MIKKIIYFHVLFIFILGLSACGFHLQQSRDLAPPLHRMFLKTPDPYGILEKTLQQYLQASNIQLVDAAQDADTILVITRDDEYQDLLSVSATQQTRQYNLRVEVAFEITDNKGRSILPAQGLSEARTITMQSNQILGNSNEANLFYQQIRRSIAYSIMNRIASKDVTKIVNDAFKKKKQ